MRLWMASSSFGIHGARAVVSLARSHALKEPSGPKWSFWRVKLEVYINVEADSSYGCLLNSKTWKGEDLIEDLHDCSGY
jgi:hypothetical protein